MMSTLLADSDLAAEITGINKDQLKNFSLILPVLPCEMEINDSTFKELLTITRNMDLIHYGWYYMSSSVHKILVHSCDTIKYFDLQIT